MADCLYCKHVCPVEDNHGEYHSICVCAESDEFLHSVSIAFGGCECGEKEDDADG